MTRVVNLRFDPYDVYIGRCGHGLDGYFGNNHPVYLEGKSWTECPFCRKKHQRGEALEVYASEFEQRIKSDEQFRAAVLELKDKTLGCFCRPKEGFRGKLLCHGQIIAGFLDGIKPQEIE